MKRLVAFVALAFLCGMGLSILSTDVHAVMIDLNDFYLDPSEGSIAADGSSATLEVNDPAWNSALLVNDPLWFDPGISVDADSLSISFGFDFHEESGNDTELYVRLLDGHNGDELDYLQIDATSIEGTHTFDLTALLSGQTLLGMDFTLTEYNSGGVGSWARITNLDLAERDNPIEPVPEPATIMLLGTGLVALGGGMRRKHRQINR